MRPLTKSLFCAMISGSKQNSKTIKSRRDERKTNDHSSTEVWRQRTDDRRLDYPDLAQSCDTGCHPARRNVHHVQSGCDHGPCGQGIRPESQPRPIAFSASTRCEPEVGLMSDTLRSPPEPVMPRLGKTPLRDRVKIVRPLSHIARLPAEPDDSEETSLDEATPSSSNQRMTIEQFKKEIEI